MSRTIFEDMGYIQITAKGSDEEARRAALYVADRLGDDIPWLIKVLDSLGLRERLGGER